MKKPKKPAKSEILPSRHALASLVKGDPMQRTMNNYAKKAPSGANALGLGSLLTMGRR